MLFSFSTSNHYKTLYKNDYVADVQIEALIGDEDDTKAYELFSKEIARAGDVTTQKRFYMGEYGWANSKDVLLGKTDKLIKAENYDRFELDNIIKWWKKLSTKRYTKMIREDKVRRELEVWNKDTMDKIDIIR